MGLGELKEWKNHYIFYENGKEKNIFEIFQWTLRANIFESKYYEYFLSEFTELAFKKGYINHPKKYYKELENGALVHKHLQNVWFWDYNKTNPKLNVKYLFSDGTIGCNCRWKKLRQN